jgi:hypothetical protein
MQYLGWALFQSDAELGLNQELSNTVMQIYAQTAPEALPSLLLLSRLEGYSPGKLLPFTKFFFFFFFVLVFFGYEGGDRQPLTHGPGGLTNILVIITSKQTFTP